MDIGRVMQIMDASYRTRRIIEHSLHEIDRRALNAMVLVKRHGNKLAGYGVVAHSFREQAAQLEKAAAPLQQSIAPLVRANMRILQLRRYAEVFRRAVKNTAAGRGVGCTLCGSAKGWQHSIAEEEAGAQSILRHLVQIAIRLQEGIAEQEYVVTNGRIEAALSERSGAPLMRVSQEMGVAVASVREAIGGYRNDLEEVLHESSTGI
ncbi:MAG TPA: hypothetical protein VMD98_10435 [Bryocella sp.]|nr:hypothetical protein [Bryocella sp.]